MRYLPTLCIRSAFCAAAAVAALLAVSCIDGTPGIDTGPDTEPSDTPPSVDCETKEDCAPGQACIDGDCRDKQSCDGRGDCPTGMVCVSNVCEKEQSCTDLSDCPVNLRCIDGICQEPCTRDRHCPDGQSCVFGECSDSPFQRDAGDSSDAGCMGCRLDTDAGQGRCVDGNSKEACGTGGETCTPCNEDEKCCTDPSKCQVGTCVDEPCNPSTCPHGCCTDEGECVSGDEPGQCGSAGNSCSPCGDGEVCQSGSCVNCGPSNCNGCCRQVDPTQKDPCVTQMTDKNCGANGAMCMQCGSNEVCVNGQCVSGCSVCNSGCCNDKGNCVSGTKDGACGSGGNACWECPDGWICDAQLCKVKQNSRWDVIAISGKVPRADVNGNYWDSQNNKPDVFLEVTVNGPTQTKSGKTPSVDGDRTPTWRHTTVSDVRAPALKGANNVTFVLKDEDIWFHDKIAECQKSFQESDFTGSKVTFTCKGAQNGPNPVTTEITLRLRLH